MFKTEKLLTKRIKTELSKNPSILLQEELKSNTYMAEQLNLGHGVPDLVISFCSEVKSRTQALTLFEINLLNIIQKLEVICREDLEELVRGSSIKLKKAIAKLVEEGFVQLDEQFISLVNNYENYQRETFAIEIKLKNWKRALEQAYRYKNFAFHTYVFMDEKHINPAIKNKELFLQYNVGLASVSTDGDIQIIYKPSKGSPFDERMNMLLNENIVTYYLSCKKVNQVSR